MDGAGPDAFAYLKGLVVLELDGGYSMYRIPFFAFTVSFIDSRGAVWSTRGGDPEYRMTQREPGGETTLMVELKPADPPSPCPRSRRFTAPWVDAFGDRPPEA